MDLFLKTYKALFKKEFGDYGFRCLGSTHWRVVNDVYQAFHLWRISRDGTCQLSFGIVPLCYEMEAYHVRFGALLSFQPYDFLGCKEYCWRYDTKSEESIKGCCHQVILFIRSYLIPYFERGIDCKSAREENLKIYAYRYERFCTAAQGNSELLQQVGEYWPGGEFECLMAIKIGEYGQAAEYLLKQIASRKKHLEENRTREEDYEEDYYERQEGYIAEWTSLLDHCMARDKEFFIDFLRESERKSRIALGLEKEESKEGKAT